MRALKSLSSFIFLLSVLCSKAYAQSQYALDTVHNRIVNGVRLYNDTVIDNVRTIFFEKSELAIYSDTSSVDVLTDNIVDAERIVKYINKLKDPYDSHHKDKKRIFVGIVEDPGLYTIQIKNSTETRMWDLYVYSTPEPFNSVRDSMQLYSILNFDAVNSNEPARKKIKDVVNQLSLYLNYYIKPDMWTKRVNELAVKLSTITTSTVTPAPIPAPTNLALILDTGSLKCVTISGDNNDRESCDKLINQYFDSVLLILMDTLIYKDTLMQINDSVRLSPKKFVESIITPFVENNMNCLLAWLSAPKQGIIFKEDYSFVNRTIGLSDKAPGILFDFRKKYFTQMVFCIHLCYVPPTK